MTAHENIQELKNEEINEKVKEITSRPDCQDKHCFDIYLFSVYDLVLKKFSPIVSMSSIDEAKQQYKNIVDYSNTMLSHYPENFDLMYVGKFNTQNALIFAEKDEDCPKLICNLKDLQSEEANSYYQVLNSVNASLNTMDSKIKYFSRLNDEISDMTDLATKRLTKLNLLIDNSVDLFPAIDEKQSKKAFMDLTETVKDKTADFIERNEEFEKAVLDEEDIYC